MRRKCEIIVLCAHRSCWLLNFSSKACPSGPTTSGGGWMTESQSKNRSSGPNQEYAKDSGTDFFCSFRVTPLVIDCVY